MPSVGNIAFEMTVKGQNVLRWPHESVDQFKAKPSLSGIPFMGPWANRLDEQAFYANGKRYAFDMELGNVRGAIPIHGFLSSTNQWKVVEAKSDGTAAWVTSRLDFFRNPMWMKQFPFAHAIEMTYRLESGVLEVRTSIENMSQEPMPVSIGFHPYFQLTDSPRDDWTISAGVKTHWLLAPNKIPTGETQPVETVFPNPASAALRDHDLDHVFSDLVRDGSGRAVMTVKGKSQQLDVIVGPELSRDGDVRAQAAGRQRAEPQLHLLRADGGDHQRHEPRAQGPLQGVAEHSARRDVAGKFLDKGDGILVRWRSFGRSVVRKVLSGRVARLIGTCRTTGRPSDRTTGSNKQGDT